MRRARITAGVAALLAAGTLAGCSLMIPTNGAAPPSEPADAPASQSGECNAVFATASVDMTEHYATHEFYSDAYDELYARGEWTSEEEAEIDRIHEDEIAKFDALIDPIYDACDGVNGLYEGAYKHRDAADWGLADVPAFTSEELKAMFISSYCYDMTDRLACNDFVAEDWG